MSWLWHHDKSYRAKETPSWRMHLSESSVRVLWQDASLSKDASEFAELCVVRLWWKVDFPYLQEHHKVCDNFPLRCENCEEEVPRKDVRGAVVIGFFLWCLVKGAWFLFAQLEDHVKNKCSHVKCSCGDLVSCASLSPFICNWCVGGWVCIN